MSYMINLKPALFLTLVCSLIFFSCEPNLNGVPEIKAITVNSFFSPQDTVRVNISSVKSSTTFDQDNFINNATVYLELPDKSILMYYLDTFLYRSRISPYPGLYKLPDLIPQLPGEYKLTVQIPGEAPITAKDSIPQKVQIENASLIADTNRNETHFLLSFKDPPARQNYYSISLNTHYYGSSWYSDSDSSGGGYYVNHVSSLYNSIINAENTIVEGVVIIGLSQIIFSDEKLSHTGDLTTIRVNYEDAKIRYSDYDSIVFELQLNSLSYNYYRYAMDYYNQRVADKEFYSDPVGVHSNIENGYGIFAGYNKASKKIVYSKGRIYYQ